MKFIFVFSTLLLCISICAAYIPRLLNGRPKGGFVGAPARSSRNSFLEHLHLSPVPDQWFDQRLDHFDASNQATWKQRYFSNKAFYKDGGPLFVSIGGEGKANPIWMAYGSWLDYAKKYGAHCVLLEHRFYGDSHPTKDMSPANLKFLSSEQALADLAAFITQQKKMLAGSPKVVVFGGSYPGSLAAWFRLKYPHLADGAVASSAPLLAKVNFIEYLEVVDASLMTYDASKGACNTAVSQATQNIQIMVATYGGRQQLQKMFKLCDSLDPNVAKDIMNFYQTLVGNFEGVVQYNKDNRAFEGAVGTNITVDTLCDIMTDTSNGSPLERYAMVNTLIMKTYDEDCQDFKYDKMIDSMRETSWNSSAAEGGRQWTYQTCTEFGFYQSSDSSKQPFGHSFPIEFSTAQCADIYGSTYNLSVIDRGVERTNQNYGAKGIRVSNIVFPNGSIDPWHALGITEDLGPDALAVFINGTAHCANMYPATPKDSLGLVAARVKIEANIGKWLTK